MLLQAFCSETRADYSQYVPRLLIGLIQLFGDPEASVVAAAWEALNAVTEVVTCCPILLSTLV